MHLFWRAAQLKETLRINYDGVNLVTEALLPLLNQTPGQGRIITLTSRLGQVDAALTADSLRKK
jgi:NAD(P)-dependent dehydrogenase (short-subunit alcohol dehydrogenase family)